jgi:hypothetical protein
MSFMQHTYTSHPIITTLYRSGVTVLAFILALTWGVVAIYYLSSHTLSPDIMRWSLAVTLSSLCAGALARFFYIPLQKTRITVSETSITLFTPFRTQDLEFNKISRIRSNRYSLLGGMLVVYGPDEKILFSSLVDNFENLLLDLHNGLKAAKKEALLADKKYARAEARLRVHMLAVDRLSFFWQPLLRLALYCGLGLGLVSTILWGFLFPLSLWCMIGGAVIVVGAFSAANCFLSVREVKGKISRLSQNFEQAESSAFYGAALAGILVVLICGIVCKFFI